MSFFHLPRLRTTYTVHKAVRPRSECAIVLHHGIFHSRQQFVRIVEELNALGFHVAMIDQQSEGVGWLRNFIGAKQYRDNMARAVKVIEELHLPVGWYVLHSMGALIGEEMQQQYPQ